MQTIIFNGQGALKEDTTEDRRLYDAFPPIRVLYGQAKALTGIDMPGIAFEGTIEERRRYQQFIVFLKQAALATLVQGGMEVNRRKIIDLGFTNPINAAMGLSSGEYNGWLTANVGNFSALAEIMACRNELMWPINAGGLTTYLGVTREDLEAACKEEGVEDLAILKCDGNYSVGAVQEVRERIYQRLKEEKKVKKAIPTDTRGAIHTQEFEEVAKIFSSFLWDYQENLFTPSIKIFSGAYARPYYPMVGDLIAGGSDHICKTFYFQQNVEKAIKPSFKKGVKHTFLVVGQGAAELEKIVGRICVSAKKKWAKGVEKGVAAWDGLETKVIEDTRSVINYWKEKGFRPNFELKLEPGFV
ncbi:hypothetical protein KY306_02345 [Candidatus Woesearchaeota archaeon]|nr:hypothetical protein [Candidatus Woesearchaeota archaeon]